MAVSSKYPDLTIDLGEGFTPLAEDERVFVFRSNDGWAATAIRSYLNCMAAAGIDNEHTKAVEAELHKFEAWMLDNPERVKQPTTEFEGNNFDLEWGPADG